MKLKYNNSVGNSNYSSCPSAYFIIMSILVTVHLLFVLLLPVYMLRVATLNEVLALIIPEFLLILQVIGLISIMRLKKRWGVYLFVASAFLNFSYQLYFHVNPQHVVVWLLGIILLLVAINIGGKYKAWKCLH